MNNFKNFLSNAKLWATHPTTFSYLGVAGLIGTGILTFISTKKWIEWKEEKKAEETEEPTVGQKVKDAAKTALYFAPPALTAAAASYCIIHGNNKAIDYADMVLSRNYSMAGRLDKYKGFAAGALASELKDAKPDDEERVCNNPHNLYFSDDDLQHENYGEELVFYIEGINTDDNERLWFRSTMLEVIMAEYEFNKFLWSRRNGEFASLNELLLMYGAENVNYGDSCGWSKEQGFDDGYDWVEFRHKKIHFDDGTYGYLIIFESEPKFDEVFRFYQDYKWALSKD